MLTVSAVLDVLLPAAVVTAAAELGVQTVDRLALNPADLEPADRRPHVLLNLADVAGASLTFHIEDIEPPVEQLADRGFGARAAALVHLV
jgi:ABC-type branched-subunit amino acid transport system substrate-binding protein